MEPPNLNSLPPEDDPLEVWLRTATPGAPRRDDGFSTRVLAALPPRRPVFPWRRTGVCAGGAILGAVAMRLDVGEWPTLASICEPVGRVARPAITWGSDPWIAAAMAIVVLGATAAVAILFALRDAESADPLF